MPTTRILANDHQLLQQLAQRTGKQQQEIIHEALDSYQRDRLLDETNAAFARLRAQPAKWAAELAERGAWDSAAGDHVGKE